MLHLSLQVLEVQNQSLIIITIAQPRTTYLCMESEVRRLKLMSYELSISLHDGERQCTMHNRQSLLQDVAGVGALVSKSHFRYNY